MKYPRYDSQMLCSPSFIVVIMTDKIKVADWGLMLLVVQFHSLGLKSMRQCTVESSPASACWESWAAVGLVHTSTTSASSPALFTFGEIQHLLRSFICPGRIQRLSEILCLPVYSASPILHAVLPIFLSAAPKVGRSHIQDEQPLEQAISGCMHLDYLPLPPLLH